MVDHSLREIVTKFKAAILAAKDGQCFVDDFSFNQFPRGCCGDTCYLLAEYLKTKGIQTIYVCGSDHGQSHAWLVIKDHRVKEPTPRSHNIYEFPDDIKHLIALYGGENVMDKDHKRDNTNYEEGDLIDGIIIDITADQFGEMPIYILII